MQKKLISAAVAAAIGTGTAFTAQTASADSVTVYGQARQELHWQDNGVTDGIRIDDTGAQTRLGVKADKDLGNGLTAIAVMEWIVELCGASGGTGGGAAGSANLTTGAVALGSGGCRQDFATARQQFVALKGGFGQIAFGRFNGSYKTHGSVTYDAFGATGLQARGNGGQSGGAFTANGFVDDMVEYKSPKLGMFTFQIQYGLDDPQNPAGAKDTKGDYNIAARISGGKDWQVIAAASHDDSSSADNFKIGGKMQFGPLSVAAQYEDVESGGAGSYVWGQLVYKVGKLDVIGGYGQFSADAGGADSNHLAVGVKYHMGKKVFTYAGYAQTDPDGGNKVKNVSVGMHISF